MNLHDTIATLLVLAGGIALIAGAVWFNARSHGRRAGDGRGEV